MDIKKSDFNEQASSIMILNGRMFAEILFVKKYPFRGIDEKALEKLDIFGVFLTENKLHLKCITCAGCYDNKIFTTTKSRTETAAHKM